MNFGDKLEKITKANDSLLCIGLDPDLEKIPSKFKKSKTPIFDFNKAIIDKTSDLVCAYKPNSAFYEAYGVEGLDQLKKTLLYLQNNFLEIPIILDSKRADIANTAKMYARSIFEYWGADATTVYPYLGLDSIEPFLAHRDKYTFLLVKTSNSDSATFQNLKTEKGPYYLAVANQIKKWERENIGIFVGATYPKELAELRNIFPDKIILSAGMGAQEAQVKAAVQAGLDKNKKGIIFNASRSIIYSRSPRESAQKLKDEINKWR